MNYKLGVKNVKLKLYYVIRNSKRSITKINLKKIKNQSSLPAAFANTEIGQLHFLRSRPTNKQLLPICLELDQNSDACQHSNGPGYVVLGLCTLNVILYYYYMFNAFNYNYLNPIICKFSLTF